MRYLVCERVVESRHYYVEAENSDEAILVASLGMQPVSIKNHERDWDAFEDKEESK